MGFINHLWTGGPTLWKIEKVLKRDVPWSYIKKILVALNQIFHGAQMFVHQTSGLYYLGVNYKRMCKTHREPRAENDLEIVASPHLYVSLQIRMVYRYISVYICDILDIIYVIVICDWIGTPILRIQEVNVQGVQTPISIYQSINQSIYLSIYLSI